jgi:hypothetical protein
VTASNARPCGLEKSTPPKVTEILSQVNRG